MSVLVACRRLAVGCSEEQDKSAEHNVRCGSRPLNRDHRKQ